MGAGRISAHAGQSRDHIETILATMPGVLLAIDEAHLRVRQAIRRSSQVGDVLAPAVERLDQALNDLSLIQSAASAAWSDGQDRRWSEDGKTT